MQSAAAQDRHQLYDSEQPSVAQDRGQQHDLAESSAFQDAGQLHDLEQSSVAKDGNEQRDLVHPSAAQNGGQLYDLEQPSAVLSGGQQHELVQSSVGQKHDLVESSAAQNGLQQHNPEQNLAAEDGAQQHHPLQVSAAQDGRQVHDMEQCVPAQHGDQQHPLEQRSAAQHGCKLKHLEPSLPAQDEEQQHDAEHSAAGAASRPRGIADIIKRFDSGSVWGSFQQGAHVKGPSPGSPKHAQHRARAKMPSVDSIEHAQQSPRISALMPQGEREEEHSSGPTELDLPAEDQGDESPVAAVNSNRSLLLEGSLNQPGLEGLLRHASLTKSAALQPQETGQGSFALPQLQGQGSSMRGDLWLPQLWLEPAKDMQDLPFPRNKMQKAMEAVRAAERAVEAASVFSPTRLETLLDAN